MVKKSEAGGETGPIEEDGNREQGGEENTE